MTLLTPLFILPFEVASAGDGHVSRLKGCSIKQKIIDTVNWSFLSPLKIQPFWALQYKRMITLLDTPKDIPALAFHISREMDYPYYR